jgi:S1-C subfamily serine protease
MSKHIAAWLLPALVIAGYPATGKAELDKKLQEAEARRVAVIKKVQPAVVAVMTGGGSGVLISDDGYALTNFHVTNAAGSPFLKCGLPDGVLYDAVLVGLDKIGDVALIKLLPKKAGDKFPFAPLGDSDKVKIGDWSLAMGNPFLLATDFTPTVTFGLVSGVHRYQYPAGTLLEYTDCIQIDTSINPGNSGGPLFNMEGELIGINGRGSFDKRGRVNSGVGYAISINQIKNFMGQLRAGLDTDHASLGALIESENDEGALSKLVVKAMIPSDAQNRGLEVGDEILSFAGRQMTSVNQFKNVLGLYPRGWRLPVVYRRNNSERREVLVRLMGVLPRDLLTGQPAAQPQPGPGPGPRPGPGPGPRPAPKADSPATKFFEAKAGFANYYFNKLERDRLLAAFKAHGDFTSLQGNWSLKATGSLKGKRAVSEVAVKDKGARDGKGDLVEGVFDGLDWSLEPLNPEQKNKEPEDPPESGGFLSAMYQWRQLLAFGEKGFVGEFTHGGLEPFYYPVADKERPDYAKMRIDCEVLRTKHTGITGKWYFAAADDPARKLLKGQLLGFEITVDPEKDPCEVYLSDYQKVDGRLLPQHIEVHHADKNFLTFNTVTYKLNPAK